ncbi:MAG: restriction endonuclease subunit S, partial [Candidatus Pacebacteria bacterium]|nr:restriction endonuclease subunit S [Candidatus Paceibacterota bacterium]
MTTWQTKKLGKICEIRTGKKDVDEGNPSGKYPFFSCSREMNYSDTYSFDTEAILIAGNGDVGNTKIYKGKFEAYQRTYVLDKFQENIKYIYYYLFGNLKGILVRSKSGSTMPYIKKGDLEKFNILVPESKNIQRKIVYVLD